MMGFRRYQAISAAMALALSMPAMVAAAGLPDKVVPCDGISCNCGDLVLLAQNILNTGIYFAVFISAVLFAWAGWKMLVAKSSGEGEGIGQAKKVLWNVMVGLVIILAAWLLVDTLMKTMLKSQVWNSICPR